MAQVTFCYNGNISPCPYTDDCLNYPRGCEGFSYWCGRFETREDRRSQRKGKELLESIRDKNEGSKNG